MIGLKVFKFQNLELGYKGKMPSLFTQNIYFHGNFKEHVTEAIVAYIKMLPPSFWGRKINVSKDNINEMIAISDGRRAYILYEHEILSELI